MTERAATKIRHSWTEPDTRYRDRTCNRCGIHARRFGVGRSSYHEWWAPDGRHGFTAGAGNDQSIPACTDLSEATMYVRHDWIKQDDNGQNKLCRQCEMRVDRLGREVWFSLPGQRAQQVTDDTNVPGCAGYPALDTTVVAIPARQAGA